MKLILIAEETEKCSKCGSKATWGILDGDITICACDKCKVASWQGCPTFKIVYRDEVEKLLKLTASRQSEYDANVGLGLLQNFIEEVFEVKKSEFP